MVNHRRNVTLAAVKCQELGRSWYEYTKDETRDRISIEWAQENSADFYATARKLMNIEGNENA